MGTGRVEAFSDGVIAVIITIMVLDLHVPKSADLAGLLELAPALAIYALSFVVVGIFWNNHHHTLAGAVVADARLLWSNLALLFALSLIPFVTAFVASSHGAPLPLACYTFVLGSSSLTFTLLGRVIAFQYDDEAKRRRLLTVARKGAIVMVLYAIAIPLAFVSTGVTYAILIAIPIWYVLPDKRLVVPESET